MSNLGFSYAQAAKGLAPSSNVSSHPTSSASSEHGSKDQAAISDTVSSQPRLAKSMSKPEQDSSLLQKTSQGTSSVEEDGTRNERFSQSDAAAAEEQRKPPVQRNDSEDVKARRDRVSSTTSTTEEPSDKGRKSSESGNAQEKAKEVDDDWEKVSIPSSSADKSEKELKSAPVPVVNFWQQRMAANQAKLKEQATPRQATTPSAAPTKSKTNTTMTTDETKKKNVAMNRAASEDNPPTTNSKPARAQQNSDTTSQSAPKQEDKVAAQKPPLVDAESWPTVDKSGIADGRRSSTAEKGEKNDSNETKASNRKNQWTQLPFVPSVKFETQMPAARRGGRSAATRGRGGTTGQGERTSGSEAGSMAPPPVPKTATEQDRGRKGAAAKTIRTSSIASDGQQVGAAKAQTSAASSFPMKDSSISDVPSTSSKERASGTDTPATQDPSRSSSRHAPAASTVPSKLDIDASVFTSAETTESPSRTSFQSDRQRSSPSSGFKNGNEASDKSQNKDWQKERASSAQKSENWRGDRQRGTERADRGRANYRGRGNHAGFSNPAFTSPLPQTGFETSKQNGQVDPRNRQPSQPYISPYGSMRSNPRSQSIPLQILQGGFFQPQSSFLQNLPPIQTDMSYGYGPMPNGMPTSIMSAMPYGDQLNGFALISMVATQIEYYFSLDNLCKDMYLRKNMDSQGFVSLRVIAEFKRIKALLGEGSMSYDHLRHVASQVRNIEFVIDENSEDRLRSRGNWRDFVLPMDQRLPEAQNEGPKVKSSHPQHSTGMVPDFQMSNGLRSAPPNINGFHDASPPQNGISDVQSGPAAEVQSAEQWASRVDSAKPEEERRISTNSPLSKVQSHTQSSGYASMTNGHRDSMSSSSTQRENTFPDEEVAKLKVVVKDPDYPSNEEPQLSEPMPIRVSGLRGGASSPEHFDKMRNLQFGQTGSNSDKNEHTIYFTTQGEAPGRYLRPGYIHEEYLALREQALGQRAEGHFEGACVPLYPLWAAFLTAPNQFNVGMYEDFKTWSLEDEQRGSDNGKNHLVKFYDAMLSAKNLMTHRLAADIINIARNETGPNRPTWLKLRAAWRNGATNLKTRKRLTDILTIEEQAELERRT